MKEKKNRKSSDDFYLASFFQILIIIIPIKIRFFFCSFLNLLPFIHISYDQCWYDNIGATSRTRQYWGPTPLTDVNGAMLDYPCGGYNTLLLWVNTSAVKTALHVPQDAVFFSGDNGDGFNYTLTEKNLLPFYQFATQNASLRVLVYNGDTDPGINSFISQNWTRALGLEETESWRPWTLDGKEEVVGYVTRYKNNFDFLTIRGSGHMVG